MRIVLLLSLLTCSLYVDAMQQVDQAVVTITTVDESAVQTPTESTGAASSAQAEAPATQASMVDTMQNYAQQLVTQLQPHLKPFGIGALAGASLGCLETEIINPIVSYLLASFKSDLLVVAAEAGIIGGAAYTVSQNQDEETAKENTKPAKLIGVLAGLIAWYALHG